MALVNIHCDAQITLPRDIREAARPDDGDYTEAKVTGDRDIVLRPVSVAGPEPTPEQKTEVLAADDEARSLHADQRGY